MRAFARECGFPVLEAEGKERVVRGLLGECVGEKGLAVVRSWPMFSFKITFHERKSQASSARILSFTQTRCQQLSTAVSSALSPAKNKWPHGPKGDLVPEATIPELTPVVYLASHPPPLFPMDKFAQKRNSQSDLLAL